MMGPSALSDLSDEPSAIRNLTDEQKDRLTTVLDRYLAALEGGVPPKPEDLFEEHPDLADRLRVYLDSLNELHAAAAGFARPAERPPLETEPAESESRRLGDFVLGDEIGRGGMGVVYEARQISLGRRVALKVLPFAAVLDARQIARFKNEAKAAAQLHHPNIVPVFAVGAERGVHYYAMQYIDGQPLDRAIAQLRQREPPGTVPATEGASSAGTTLGEAVGPPRSPEATTKDWPGPIARSYLARNSAGRRQYFDTVIRLGIQAAEALHAAHELGIVHRDVKPSNLMLDSDGKLWVTDFGLARCQCGSTVTRTGDVVGTLRYMSPEQALGQAALVDQRTDVYSLGITLYELLALRPAFPQEDGQALLRSIDQQEPPRPSRLRPGVPADLETVVLKAMAKQREDRYSTAGQFADDLRRVLEGKATLARPLTVVDRLGRWARRHRRTAAAAVAVCLLFAVGSAAGTLLVAREKLKADWNYARAERNFRDARGAVDRFGARLADRLASIPGAGEVRRELLQDTLAYYRDFVKQASGDPSLRAELARTYGNMGMLIGEIGSAKESLEAHQNASRLLEQLAAQQPQVADYRRQLGVSRNNVAMGLAGAGRTDDARRAYREAIRLQERLVADDPRNAVYQADLALSLGNLGLLESQTGASAEARALLGRAIRIQEPLAALKPDDPDALRRLAASYNNLSALDDAAAPARAAELRRRALEFQIKAAQARPADLKYQSDAALGWNNLGAVQSRLQRHRDAAESYRRAIAIQERLVVADPARKSYARELAVSHNNLGLAQSAMRQPAEAERSFRKALELQEKLVGQHPDDPELHSSLGGMYNNLGIVMEELRRAADAADSFQRAIEHQRIASSRAADVSRYRLFLSTHYRNYGRVLRQLGRADEAVRVALARKELWAGDPDRLFTVAEELALASQSLAGRTTPAGLSAQGCANLAVEVLREAVAAGLKLPADLDRNESFAALKNYPRFSELVRHGG